MRIDPTGRQPGRGAYLCADGGCWQLAIQKGALQHALKAPIPPDLRTTLEAGPLPSQAAAEARPSGAQTTHQGGTRGQE